MILLLKAGKQNFNRYKIIASLLRVQVVMTKKNSEYLQEEEYPF
jgi:hypothetical protein